MAEILAPAGTLEMACAALDAGADAIYAGPLGWSRRPFESEMTDQEIGQMIEYAQKLGRSVRIVFNTFPSPLDMPDVLKKVDLFAQMGAHGFIVTDVGLIRLLKQKYPDKRIHVSIGSGITNAWDAKFYEDQGADVIILPYRWGGRELKQVQEISNIGLETFLFETVQTGIVCPGNCIMSSYLEYRDWTEAEARQKTHGSANRGAKECYRVCQVSWKLIEEEEYQGNRKLRKDAQLMLWQLPEFVRIGVQYFKISGRERPTRIIHDLVQFYRKAIDGIKDGSQLDMSVYQDEVATLGERWVKEKRKRVGTLMGRAKSYQKGQGVTDGSI